MARRRLALLLVLPACAAPHGFHAPQVAPEASDASPEVLVTADDELPPRLRGQANAAKPPGASPRAPETASARPRSAASIALRSEKPRAAEAAGAPRPRRDAASQDQEIWASAPSAVAQEDARRPDGASGVQDAAQAEPSAPEEVVADANMTAERPSTVAPSGPAWSGVIVGHEVGPHRRFKPLQARATAWVQGIRARTVVDLVFDVPEGGATQASFHYTLPSDAVLAGFSVYDPPFDGLFRADGPPPQWPAGFVSPSPSTLTPDAGWGVRRDGRVDLTARSTEVAERQVRQGEPSSTMVWAGGRQVRIDIHPVEAGRPVRVVLAYEETLAIDEQGLARFALALPEGAKHRAVTLLTDGRTKLKAGPSGRWRSAGLWRRQEVLRAPARPQWTFAVGDAPVVLRGSDVRGAGEAGLPGEFYFARVRLPKRASVTATKDAVIIIDVSRRDDKDGGAARQIALMEQILSKDVSIERYAVLLYSVGTRWLHGEGWRANSLQNRQQTQQALAGIYRDGASDPSVAVDALLSASWLGTDAQAFLLTLGPRTWGASDARVVRRARAAPVRWHVYALSAPVGDELVELAADGGGWVVPVRNGDALQAAVDAHRQGPSRALRVHVDGVDAQPVGLPSRVSAGAVVHFAGRVAAGASATATVHWGDQVVARVPIVSDASRAPSAPHASRKSRAPSLGQDPLAARAWAQTALTAWRRAGVQSSSWVAVAKWFRLAPDGTAFRTVANDVPRTDLAVVQNTLLRLDRDESPTIDRFVLTAEAEAAVQTLRRLADRADRVRGPHRAEPSRRRIELPPSPLPPTTKHTKDGLYALRAIVRERMAQDDEDGAVVALAGYAAARPVDPEIQRVVGFTLLSLGRAAAAADVLERLRLLRPFEAQAWLTSGLAFEAAGRPDRALARYATVWTGRWKEQSSAVRTVAALYIRHLLQSALRTSSSDALRELSRRVDAWLMPQAVKSGLTMTLHWSASVDLDLIVYGPDGRRCASTHCDSRSGRLLVDVKKGPGPEAFVAPTGYHGPIDALVETKDNSRYRRDAPVVVLLVTDALDGLRHYTVRLLPTDQFVAVIRSDRM